VVYLSATYGESALFKTVGRPKQTMKSRGSFSLPQARLVRTVVHLFALDATASIARACVVDSSIKLY